MDVNRPVPVARSILVVEDDAKIADMLANYLRAQGFDAAIVGDGRDAVNTVRQRPPALVLLDLMLPGLDGVAVCRELRQFSDVPIIMVTARVDEIDRLLGLDVGADDYICKPFSPREVVARVNALLRRAEGRLSPQSTGPVGRVDATVPAAFQIDLPGQRALWRGQSLPLTPVEFRLFKLLLSRPGHVFARARLLDAVHEDFRDVSDRAIDSHIKNLRRKLEQAGATEASIVSVYGAGYRFDAAS
jgi:two-component system, OmpR family, response regulator BaeR